MELTIKTKYSIDDIVYGVYNGFFWKFKITEIKAYTHLYKEGQMAPDVEYICSSVPNDGNELCLQQKFFEHQLKTKEELSMILSTILEQ